MTGRYLSKKFGKILSPGALVFSILSMTVALPVNAQNVVGTKSRPWTDREDKVENSGKSQWFADMNGDGRDDFIYNKEGTKEYWGKLSDAGSTAIVLTLGPDVDKLFTRGHSVGFDKDGQWFADVDHDGKQDFLYNHKNTKDYRLILGRSPGVETTWGTRQHDVGFDGRGQWFVDMNSDGRADYVYNDGNTRDYRVILSGGSTGGNDEKWGTREHGVEADGVAQWLVDVTGDGYVDYVYNDSNSLDYRVMVNNGGRGFDGDRLLGRRTDDVDSDRKDQWFTDMNGDGRADLVYQKDGKRDYVVQFTSSGRNASLGNSQNWGSRDHGIADGGNALWIIDANGDNRADILYNDSNTADYRIITNLGDRFAKDRKWGTRQYNVENGGDSQWLADINGDGLTDHIYNRDNERTYYLMAGLNSAPSDFTMIIASDPQPDWGGEELNHSVNDKVSFAMNLVTAAGPWPACLAQGGNQGISPPVGVIVNGDLTDYFRGYQFKNYQSWFHDDLYTLTFPGLGNHDYHNNVDDCGNNGCAKDAVKFMKGTVNNDSIFYFNQAFLTGGESSDDSYDKDSMAYSFDIGNYHFVQMHNYPTYKVNISGTKIKSSIPWLKVNLTAATARGQKIIINFHDYGDHMSKHNTKFLNALVGQNVVALFVGHVHQDFGYWGHVKSRDEDRNRVNLPRTIPYFRSGGAISVDKNDNEDRYPVGKFLLVRFTENYMNVGVIDYLSGTPKFHSNQCGAVCSAASMLDGSAPENDYTCLNTYTFDNLQNAR